MKKRYEDFIRRNPDGRIKKEDFSPELKSWCSIQNAEKLETLVFEAFDANNDGYIDFKELMVIFYLLNNGKPEEKTKHVFQLCDIDKDGTVSYAEICYLFSFIQPEIPGKIMEARKKYCIYIRFIRTILYSTLKYVFSSERA